MKVLSLCSPYINDILQDKDLDIKKIKYKYLPSLIHYSKDIIELTGEEKVSGIEDITGESDIVILDFLSIIERGKEYKGKIIGVDQSQKCTRQLKDDVQDVLLESLSVISNKLLRKYHPSQICIIEFMNIRFEEEGKISRGFEKSYKLLINKIDKIIPGYRRIKIEKEVLYRENKFNISKDTLNELNKAIKGLENSNGLYKGEQVYSSIKNIRYYYEKAKLFNKDRLMIIFSSFSTEEPKYNYVNTLKGVDCNKLFILDDYGSKGSYYLGLDGNFDVESSVISLITEVMMKNNITFNSVMSVGSSKGGSAALYYGLKYNFGNIIAGAPQYKIGTYLIDLTIKDYAKEIFGGVEPSRRIQYDNLIRKVAREGQLTKINILTGDGDPQYERVLKEFETVGDELKLNYKIDKCNIENHNEISKVYPKYLLENIEDIFSGKGCIKGNMLLNIFSKFN